MKNKSKHLSPCCNDVIYCSLADGVLVGSCSKCNQNVCRVNPKTGLDEWLDGKSPWTIEVLRPIEDKKNLGLHKKFQVIRNDGSSEAGQKHANCDYFVLDITHDKYARIVLKAYIEACKTNYPKLAEDLTNLLGMYEALEQERVERGDHGS